MSKTLVVGASPKPGRYAYLAVSELKKRGHEVVALGVHPGNIQGIPITTDKPLLKGIDTVTLYINAARQEEYYDYILEMKPRRIIFNPGSENPLFMRIAKLEGVEVLVACTLVMLSTGQY